MKKLAGLLIALFVLQVAVFAAPANSATVQLLNPVTVGASTLKAGTYNVSWTESGSDAQVTFAQGKKTLAVVPATVVTQKNSDTRVLTATDGQAKVLRGIDLKNASLTFTSTGAAGK